MEILTDKEVLALIKEKKKLPKNYKRLMKKFNKPGHWERKIDINGDSGNEFQIRIRQSDQNSLDFSIILGYKKGESNKILFILRRYNGKSHQHSNTIENENDFYDFHIHTATERYQMLPGANAEHFAERTDRFSDYFEAIKCLFLDCGFEIDRNFDLDFFGFGVEEEEDQLDNFKEKDNFDAFDFEDEFDCE